MKDSKAKLLPFDIEAPSKIALEIMFSLTVRKEGFQGCFVEPAVLHKTSDPDFHIPIPVCRLVGSTKEELKEYISHRIDDILECLEV